MRHEDPLYTITIECPICREENDFDAIRVGAFVEESRDTDFCPTKRKWYHPEYQAINPLVYSMATCTTCHYTRELDGTYKNWQRDTTFKTYRQKQLREQHLEALSAPDAVLKQLGTHLSVRRFPHETAINKLLLGIIDEQVMPQKGSLNVARYYLRIAWLFRGMGQISDKNSAEQVWRKGLRDRIGVQLERWAEWNEESESLGHSIAKFTETEISTKKLNEAGSNIEDLLADWQRSASGLEHSESNSEGDHTYFQFNNHTTFLMSLRNTWNEVPLSEQEALGTALHYYIEFFEHSRSFGSPEQEVQTTYLIGELARRTGQTELSSKYFNHAIRKGHELLNQFRHDYNRVSYIQSLVDMAIEQGRTNRDEPVAAA